MCQLCVRLLFEKLFHVANIDDIRGKSCYVSVEDNIYGNVDLCLLQMDVKCSYVRCAKQ